jgi:hypothetical protein
MSDGALWLLAVAVALSSVSLFMHAIASIGTFRAIKKLRDELSPLVPEIQVTLKTANEAITQTVQEVHSLVELGRDVLNDVKQQVEHIDAARADLTEQVKVHGQRLDLVVEDILGRVQEVVGVMHSSVIRPVREVTGIVAGVRTAIQTFLMGRRSSVTRATQDEEMFI